MERTVLLIKPEQRQKLVAIAKKERVSVAEINRRAIDQYTTISAEEIKILEALVDALVQSNKKAEHALKAAGKAIDMLLRTGKK